MAGDEALGVQHPPHRAKCLGTRTGSGRLAMVSLLVNFIPFLALKSPLATLMHPFVPQNDLPCRCSR